MLGYPLICFLGLRNTLKTPLVSTQALLWTAISVPRRGRDAFPPPFSSRVLSVAPSQPEEKKEHHGALRDTIAALSRVFLYHQREIPSRYEGASVGGSGQPENISHLFGPGTTVLISPVWFWGLFLDWDRSVIFWKEAQDQPKLTIILNFQPLRTNFEEEAAISTPSVIHQWKALVVVVQDFYYNATPKAPPKREYGEATRTQAPCSNHRLFP